MALVVVLQLAVARECTVLDHQRNVVLAPREAPFDVRVLLQEVETGEAHVLISPAVAPVVFVIPERRSPARVVVLMPTNVTRRDGVSRETIRLGSRDATMQMHDG